ncbi:hypothetical protein Goari_014169, partial [Gossypium aridum]|nr:hypothetical protein [Gossypium aridum]
AKRESRSTGTVRTGSASNGLEGLRFSTLEGGTISLRLGNLVKKSIFWGKKGMAKTHGKGIVIGSRPISGPNQKKSLDCELVGSANLIVEVTAMEGIMWGIEQGPDADLIEDVLLLVMGIMDDYIETLVDGIRAMELLQNLGSQIRSKLKREGFLVGFGFSRVTVSSLIF